MADALIQVRNLCKTFDGVQWVLDDVCLEVNAGSVYGLIGENGAGKTTLIRHLIGRTAPTSGSVEMFGLNPITHPAEVLGQVGYLSQPGDMPQWMRVGELIEYMSAFYANWDAGFARSMQDAFQLARLTQVSDLSRGQAARLGLLIAVAHRPPLLILDEPSSGLDPVVRSDILSEIIRSVADDGRAVFFSSHLLEEVQEIADHVGIMNEGRLVIDSPWQNLLSDHLLMKVDFPEPHLDWPLPELVVCCYREAATWHVLCEASRSEELGRTLLERTEGRVTDSATVSLDEMFACIVKSGSESPAGLVRDTHAKNVSGDDPQ